jgi:hypothetical protein
MFGVSWDDQERWGLTGSLIDIVCSANGAPTPGLLAQLADDAVQSVALGHAQTLGRIQQLPNFGAIPVHGRRATSDPFILTTFLCTLQDTPSANGAYNLSCNTRYWACG